MSKRKRSTRAKSISCPECGTDFEVVTTSPLELKAVEAGYVKKRKKKGRPKTVTTRRFRPARLLAALLFVSACLLCVLLSHVWIRTSQPRSQMLLLASKKLKPTDPYALIFGTVWGPDDHPVYGITVKIRRVPDKKPKWEVYSDHSGEFAQRVPAGEADYVVWADLKGVKTTDGKPVASGGRGPGPRRV